MKEIDLIDLQCGFKVVLSNEALIIPYSGEKINHYIYKYSSFNSVELVFESITSQLIIINKFLEIVDFVQIIKPILETFEGNDVDELLDHILFEFHELRSFFRAKDINKNELLGLYGELKFIDLLLDEGFDFEKILTAWSRPQRFPQDFVFDSFAVEVKFLGGAEKTVKIDSERQLDFRGKLYLSIYSGNTHIDYNNSSCDLDEIILKLLGICQNKLQRLKLLSACKLNDHEYNPMIHRLGLKISNENWAHYKVVEGFPRIIKDDISQCILNVKYDLNVAGLNEYLYVEKFE